MPDVRTVMKRVDRRLGVRARLQGGEVERLRRRVDTLEGRVADLRRANRRKKARIERMRERRKALQAQLRTNAAAEAPTAVTALPDTTRLELRRRAVFASTPEPRLVLEIGPAHNAIAPKREGYPTQTVDYLDREGLVERYKHHTNYDPDDIEAVDHVLAPGAAMAESIDERFDLVIASHVIEHTTSLVHFLRECTRLLEPGGVLALVVPDHRYCFDRLRERTSLAAVIDAAEHPPEVHTVGTLVEERLNAATKNGSTAWHPSARGHHGLLYGYDAARARGEQARSTPHYIDAHHWVFSPHHLRLLVEDLHQLGLVELRETWFHDTVRHEFFLNLSVDGAGPGLGRPELVALADQERRSLDRLDFGPAEPAEPAEPAAGEPTV